MDVDCRRLQAQLDDLHAACARLVLAINHETERTKAELSVQTYAAALALDEVLIRLTTEKCNVEE